jgi:hypothetical protein
MPESRTLSDIVSPLPKSFFKKDPIPPIEVLAEDKLSSNIRNKFLAYEDIAWKLKRWLKSLW